MIFLICLAIFVAFVCLGPADVYTTPLPGQGLPGGPTGARKGFVRTPWAPLGLPGYPCPGSGVLYKSAVPIVRAHIAVIGRSP